MITLESLDRRRERLAALIAPICERSENRSEHSVWPDEIKAIVAAAGQRLPVEWGDVDEQLGRILTAAKSFNQRGADQRCCIDALRQGLSRLDHAIRVRRDFREVAAVEPPPHVTEPEA